MCLPAAPPASAFITAGARLRLPYCWLALQQGYGRSLNWVLGHSRLGAGGVLATLALNVWLYISIPKTFFRNGIPGA
ncbi:hypothetical protein M8494_02360 [Serratia ureilytica]